MALLSARALAATALFLGTSLAQAQPEPTPPPPSPTEFEVKAAFLYNFAKFVEWPPDAFPEPSAPLAFCVYGDDPVSASLDAVTRGETLNGRRLVVRRLRDLLQVRECHVLFISAQEKGRLPEALSALRDARVLTVGEGQGFLDKGGMIRLFLEQNRMRFGSHHMLVNLVNADEYEEDEETEADAAAGDEELAADASRAGGGGAGTKKRRRKQQA